MAKGLANKLGYLYVDTGAMYRAVTLFCIKNGFLENGKFNKKEAIQSLDKIKIQFQKKPGEAAPTTLLSGVNVEKDIRSMEVSKQVSKVSSVREIRQKMVALQQEMGKKKGVVMEGRDIGTVVFPAAELKIFMTANIDTRVKRRYDELTAKGAKITLEEVKENISSRDYKDTHRKESPLLLAPDAVILDNTNMTPEKQLEFALNLITKR